MSLSKPASMSCKETASSRLARRYALSFSCWFRSFAAFVAFCSSLKLRKSVSFSSANSKSHGSTPTRRPSAIASVKEISSCCCTALCSISKAARRSRNSLPATSLLASCRRDSWDSMACRSCVADAVGFANKARSCSAILSPWPSRGDSSGAMHWRGVGWRCTVACSCFLGMLRLSSGASSTAILTVDCSCFNCSTNLELANRKRSFSFSSSSDTSCFATPSV
mmetsp:Transcript_27449/g.63454  ORF Transcript_27449/g.63454 Transcript_27449/m.63454 type:complete len:223 (+) Transcript_27449:814-1482(+)